MWFSFLFFLSSFYFSLATFVFLIYSLNLPELHDSVFKYVDYNLIVSNFDVILLIRKHPYRCSGRSSVGVQEEFGALALLCQNQLLHYL